MRQPLVNNVFLAVLLAIGARGTARAAASDVVHVGAPAQTHAIDYLHSCFGKPVVWVDGLQLVDPVTLPPCVSGDEKSAQAAEAVLVRRGLRLVRSGEIVVLLTEATASQPQPWMIVPPKWTGTKLTLDLKNYESEDVAQTESYEKVSLTESQMQKMAHVILNSARLVSILAPGSPVNPSIISDPKLREEARQKSYSEYVSVGLQIMFDARRFAPEGPVAIVAVLSEKNGPWGRIVYGEMKSGTYQPLWDSTEFYFSDALSVNYADLNGDGRPEIILRTNSGGMRLRYPMLAVLDLAGHELTHETRDCDLQGVMRDDMCFIVASDFFFGDDGQGKTVITAAQDFESGSGGAREYHWRNGRFVDTMAKPPRRRMQKKN